MVAWALACLGLMILPGPDMALVTRYTLSFGWKSGAATVFGIFSSYALYSVAILFGLLSLIEAFPSFLEVARVAGGLYLIYLAVSGCINLYFKKESQIEAEKTDQHLNAFKAGFISNFLNAKQYLFIFLLLPGFLPADPTTINILALLFILLIVSIIFWSVWIFSFSFFFKTNSKHHKKIETISLTALFIVGILLLVGVV
jgi:threonine/homoserine/homoserine lactone efflux protein